MREGAFEKKRENEMKSMKHMKLTDAVNNKINKILDLLMNNSEIK